MTHFCVVKTPSIDFSSFMSISCNPLLAFERLSSYPHVQLSGNPIIRRAFFFYLLDYITPAENFQIGDRKKKNAMDTLYRNFHNVYQS